MEKKNALKCENLLKQLVEPATVTRVDPDYRPPCVSYSADISSLNKNLENLGQSPLKISRLEEGQKVSYGRCKLKQILAGAQKHLARLLQVRYEVVSEPASSESCRMAASDLSDLMNVLKTKYQAVGTTTCDNNQIVGVRKTCKFFETTQYSVQRARDSSANQIQTLHELFSYCSSNIHITFFYVPEEQILNYKKKLADQFDMAVAIPGTQAYHCFQAIVLQVSHYSCYTSSSTCFTTYQITKNTQVKHHRLTGIAIDYAAS
jgi:hypothetical protein